MTIGIYKLIFKNTDKVYIGQSTALENRLSQHICNMKHASSSKKLNEAYTIYGAPCLEVLTNCEVEELDSFEIETIEIYDSINNGFNTMKDPGNRLDLKGEDHSRAVHTNEEIVSAFNTLVDYPKKTFLQVSEATGVTYSTVKHIAAGTSHTWLKDKFPERYNKLISIIGSRKATAKTAEALGLVFPNIVSPDGNIFTVNNINSFAKANDLDVAALHRLLHKKAKTHKGWRIIS